MNTLLDERQLRLLDLWCDRRADRPWPARSDFDAPDFGDALGRLALLDVIPPAADASATARPTLRYRLFGTWIVNEIGQDLTGRTTEDLARDWQRDMVRRIYDRVLTAGRPVVAVRRQSSGYRSMGHQLLALPLGGDRIDMIQTVYGLLDPAPADWRGPWPADVSYVLRQSLYDLRDDGTSDPAPYAEDAVELGAADVPFSVATVPGEQGAPRCVVTVRSARRL